MNTTSFCLKKFNVDFIFLIGCLRKEYLVVIWVVEVVKFISSNSGGFVPGKGGDSSDSREALRAPGGISAINCINSGRLEIRFSLFLAIILSDIYSEDGKLSGQDILYSTVIIIYIIPNDDL